MKPILFSTPMVQAILDGRKTQTRRIIIKEDLKDIYDSIDFMKMEHFPDKSYRAIFSTDERPGTVKSKYQVGDILWVRETWQHTKCLNINFEDENYGYVYKADGQPWEDHEGWTWKPSIFMPREAARLFLKVTNVIVERLNDMDEWDAVREGVDFKVVPNQYYFNYLTDEFSERTASQSFETLWQKLNGKESLESNPWVWVYEFEKIEKP